MGDPTTFNVLFYLLTYFFNYMSSLGALVPEERCVFYATKQ